MCPRAHYFKRLAVPELTEVSGAKVIRWQAGHHLETAIRPIIEKVYGKSGSNERMTSEKLQLTGEFDNLILHDNRLVEIKSVSDFAFITRDGKTTLKQATGNLNKWGKPEYEPKLTPYLGHELQNHAYVLLLQEKGITVTHIDYVYISLSGRLVVYSTKVDPRHTSNVINRLTALNKAWETKEPPVCICTESHPLYDSVMRWCPYKTETDCCSLKLVEAQNDLIK
jgi:CRISPR/Cas system-associated exonuclease Cas4 (RecB family)